MAGNLAYGHDPDTESQSIQYFLVATAQTRASGYHSPVHSPAILEGTEHVQNSVSKWFDFSTLVAERNPFRLVHVSLPNRKAIRIGGWPGEVPDTGVTVRCPLSYFVAQFWNHLEHTWGAKSLFSIWLYSTRPERHWCCYLQFHRRRTGAQIHRASTSTDLKMWPTRSWFDSVS